MKQTDIPEGTIHQENTLRELLINILILRRGPHQLCNPEQYDTYLHQSLGFTIDTLLQVPGDELICSLKETKQFNAGQLEQFADILFHIAEDLDEEVKSKVKERCCLIYKYVDEEDRRL